jgi:hypothetical protein
MEPLQRYKKRRKAQKNGEKEPLGCNLDQEQEETIKASIADEGQDKSALLKAFSATLFKMLQDNETARGAGDDDGNDEFVKKVVEDLLRR